MMPALLRPTAEPCAAFRCQAEADPLINYELSDLNRSADSEYSLMKGSTQASPIWKAGSRSPMQTSFESSRNPHEETRAAMKIVEEGISDKLHTKKEVIHYDSPAKEKLKRMEQAVIEEYRTSRL